MTEELDALRQRLQAYEVINQEYATLQNLVDAAAQGQIIDQVLETCVFYADPTTQRIISANEGILTLLGYTLEELLQFTVSDLEIRNALSTIEERTFVESSIEQKIYSASYRPCVGQPIPARVYSRLLQKDEGEVLHFRLEDQSLYKRLWRELRRREDDGFLFQVRLKHLNEITIQLSQINDQEELCRQTIKLGVEKLGFDRLGLWFLNHERDLMVGTYGIDEHGQLRNEHNMSWSYKGTYIAEFMLGKTEASYAYDEAPLYNEKSEVIQFGWHISAPVRHSHQVMGVLTSDNYLNKQPMKSYEPELLRLYGITIGHLTQLLRGREQAFAMRLEQERSYLLRQFVTSVGHDFRTPLAVINTKSYLIPRLQKPEQLQLLSVEISEQVKYLSTMLNSMLELIALESNLILTLETIDLTELLMQVVACYRAESQAKQIECVLYPDNNAKTKVDAQYLHRALSAILQNAIQYTPLGGHIEIRFEHYPNEIGIRIQDNGIGIEQDAHDKIFKLLYRRDEARTERRNGMGLAIAKTIVEAHRGRISVESTLGQGSTFEVVLPR